MEVVVQDCGFAMDGEAVLAKHLKQLENEKLLKKVDSVIARCHPESEWFKVPSYRFDPNRIEELDKKRIDIVHRDALGMHIPKALDSAEYLVRTALFLISLVGRHYGLQFDLRYLSFSYDKPITRK